MTRAPAVSAGRGLRHHRAKTGRRTAAHAQYRAGIPRAHADGPARRRQRAAARSAIRCRTICGSCSSIHGFSRSARERTRRSSTTPGAMICSSRLRRHATHGAIDRGAAEAVARDPRRAASRDDRFERHRRSHRGRLEQCVPTPNGRRPSSSLPTSRPRAMRACCGSCSTTCLATPGSTRRNTLRGSNSAF